MISIKSISNVKIKYHYILSDYYNSKVYFIESTDTQKRRAKQIPPTPRLVNTRKLVELPWHYSKVAYFSGKWDGMLRLLNDPSFLESITEGNRIYQLVYYFDETIKNSISECPQNEIIKLLKEAVIQDINFIARHPTTLFQCLWNKCWWYDCPDAKKYYHFSEKDNEYFKNWSKIGLFEFMESWRNKKENETPGFRWLRSLCPPSVRLGGPQKIMFKLLFPSADYIKFNNDGNKIIILNHRKKCKIFQVVDLASGIEIVAAGENNEYNSIYKFSDDYAYLVFVENLTTLKIIDLKNSSLVVKQKTINLNKSIRITHQGTEFFTFLQSDCLIIDCGSEMIQIINLRNFSEIFEIEVDNYLRYDIESSTDGKYIAINSKLQTIKIFNLIRFKEIINIKLTRSPCRQMIFSPDNRYFCTYFKRFREGGDIFFDLGVVQIWEIPSGDLLTTIQGYEPYFSPDSDFIRVKVKENENHFDTIPLTLNKQNRGLLNFKKKISGLSFIRKRKPIFYIERPDKSKDQYFIIIKDKNTGELIFKDEPFFLVRSIKRFYNYSEDEKYLAYQSTICSVKVIEIATGKLISELGVDYSERVRYTVFVGDGSRLFTIGKNMRLWDIKKGTEIGDGIGEPASATSISPDGNYLAIGTQNGMIFIWDMITIKNFACFKGHLGKIIGLFFLNDCRSLISVSEDNTVRLWDTTHNSFHPELKYPFTGISDCCFSSDGRKIFTISENGILSLWDYNNVLEVKTLSSNEVPRLSEIKFFNNSNKALGIGENIHLIDLVSFSIEKTIYISQSYSSATISPNGKYIYAVSFKESRWGTNDETSTLHIWESDSGTEIIKYKCKGLITNITSSEDGKTIVYCINHYIFVRDLNNIYGRPKVINDDFLWQNERRFKSISYDANNHKIAAYSEDDTVKIWDSEKNECLHLRQGYFNTDILVNNKEEFPWWINGIWEKDEFIIFPSGSQRPVTWFPVFLDPEKMGKIYTNANAKIWACINFKSLVIIQLEGEKPDEMEDFYFSTFIEQKDLAERRNKLRVFNKKRDRLKRQVQTQQMMQQQKPQ